MPEKIKMSWADIEYVTDKLAKKLEENEKFDAIISVGRGGMIPARLVAEKFNIQDMYIINAKAYDKNDKFDEVKTGDIKIAEHIRSVLVIDDCIFTGATFDKVITKITSDNKHITNITKAVIYKNKHITDNKIMYAEEYNGDTIWIVFPWESN